MKLDKWDFAIMHTLIENKCFSKINSVTVKELNIDKKKNTIYKRLQIMADEGYIANGFKDGRANTYYITEKGIKYFEEEVK